NRESFLNLADNLRELGMSIDRVPYVMQYNKRDLPNIGSIESLNAELNQAGAPAFSTVALTGEGVQEVLKSVSRLVITDHTKKAGGRRVLGQDGRSGAAPPPKQQAIAPPRAAPDPAAPSLEAALNQAAPPPVVHTPVPHNVAAAIAPAPVPR